MNVGPFFLSLRTHRSPRSFPFGTRPSGTRAPCDLKEVPTMLGILYNSGGDDGDGHPGTPWTPPEEPPSPDGSTPPGDGDHRE